MPLTQTQLATAVAARAELTTVEAKRILGALEEIVLEELDNAQKVRVGGLVQLTVRVKPAQKKRKGRNPATGEEIMIAAKPASVDLRARPLAKAKAALPGAESAPTTRRLKLCSAESISAQTDLPKTAWRPGQGKGISHGFGGGDPAPWAITTQRWPLSRPRAADHLLPADASGGVVRLPWS